MWDVTFKLKQSDAEWTNDYRNILKKINDWWYEYINVLNDNVYKIFVDSFLKLDKKSLFYTKSKVLSLIKWKLASLHSETASIVHPTRKSVYIDVPEPVRKWKWNSSRRNNLFQSDLELIYEKTGITINRIEKELTMEQLWRWLDKIRFDYYETFDEGKRTNDSLKIKQWLSGKQKELLDHIKATQ